MHMYNNHSVTKGTKGLNPDLKYPSQVRSQGTSFRITIRKLESVSGQHFDNYHETQMSCPCSPSNSKSP